MSPAEYRETSSGVYSWVGQVDGVWVEHTSTDLDLVLWTRVRTDGLLWAVELVDQHGHVHARRLAATPWPAAELRNAA
ncbi:MAG TPA: hypothetical protein VJ870_10425 [Amycolatopsis sp.]|nr:hypothetical protein [Amycolatopsis sp.]